MHQHTHQHAFTPILLQSPAVQPAPTRPQDSQSRQFNTHATGGMTRPYFYPVTAFQRATKKPFRSTKWGRWGALHVCIAWKIYYNEQLKRMQQRPDSLNQGPTPEDPYTSLPDSDQPSCRPARLYSPTETPEHKHQVDKSCPSDRCTSSHCPSCSTRRENLERPPNLWKEKEKREPAVTHDLDRKRPLECDSFVNVKRLKQEGVDEQLTLTPVQRAHMSDLSVFHPDSCGGHVTRSPAGRLVSHPGAEAHPYQTASWEQTWGFHQRLDPRCSGKTCRAIRTPRLKEAFHGSFAPPHFPLALKQETLYLGGREFLHLRHNNGPHHRCRLHLSHPGLLPAPYLGP